MNTLNEYGLAHIVHGRMHAHIGVRVNFLFFVFFLPFSFLCCGEIAAYTNTLTPAAAISCCVMCIVCATPSNEPMTTVSLSRPQHAAIHARIHTHAHTYIVRAHTHRHSTNSVRETSFSPNQTNPNRVFFSRFVSFRFFFIFFFFWITFYNANTKCEAMPFKHLPF